MNKNTNNTERNLYNRMSSHPTRWEQLCIKADTPDSRKYPCSPDCWAAEWPDYNMFLSKIRFAFALPIHSN